MTSLKRYLQNYFIIPDHVQHNDVRLYKVINMISPIACFFHFLFFLFFVYIHNNPLSYYNIFSITIWITIAIINKIRFHYLGILVLTIEVTGHGILSVYELGWNFGFQYYLITWIAGIFLITGHFILKLSIAVLTTGLFIILYYYSQTIEHIWTGSSTLMNVTNIANIAGAITALTITINYFRGAVDRAESALEVSHQKAENLLHNILPVAIANRLKENPRIIADVYQNASVLFVDIVDFTRLAEKVTPQKLVSILNNIFSRFDDLIEKYHLEKIKTIGDAYMVASGIPEKRKDHAEALAELALDMLGAVNDFNRTHKNKLTIRIGINSGRVVAGVIGKKKFSYDLWGDTVNTASRMESHGKSGEIQITKSTYKILKNKYEFSRRENIAIKGKGIMTTFILTKK